MPAVGRKADAELFKRFIRQSSVFDVLLGRGIVQEAITVILLSPFHNIRKSRFLRITVENRFTVIDNLHAAFLGKLLHSVRKRKILILHNEADRVAVFSTAEAMKYLLISAY